MGDHLSDPAGWTRIQELEARITEAILEIARRRELSVGNPSMETVLDAIEAPLLGWSTHYLTPDAR